MQHSLCGFVDHAETDPVLLSSCYKTPPSASTSFRLRREEASWKYET